MDESGRAYLTSSQAVSALGVKATTLYAYVSRGLLRSVRDPNGKKRLYRRSDIERLRLQAEARTGHGAAAAGAMHYGAPIMSSEITELTPEGPRYRGVLAIDAAEKFSYEDVSGLLWTGQTIKAKHTRWPAPPPIANVVHDAGEYVRKVHGADAILRLFSLYTLACSSDKSANDSLEAPRTIIQILTGCFGYLSPNEEYRHSRAGESIAQAVLASCGLSTTPENLRMLNAILITLADDELASATFVARVAASVHTELYACIVSAIESSSGWASDHRRVERLLMGVSSCNELRSRIEAFWAGGRIPPGFSSESSRGEDPRATLFLDLAKRSASPLPVSAALSEFLSKDAPRLGLFAKPILGLEVLAKTMAFPHGAVPGLFVLARCSGWVAHIIEQYTLGLNMRPRAKFTPRAEVSPTRRH